MQIFSYNREGQLKKGSSYKEVGEEYNDQDDSFTIMFWQPQEATRLILIVKNGRTVHWQYRDTRVNKTIERDTSELFLRHRPWRKMINGSWPAADSSFSCELIETPATYPGGEKALQRFLKDNLHYPADAFNGNHQSKVYISFTVKKDGTITDVSIAKSFYPSCVEDALRVVRLINKFNPARREGKTVAAKVMLPVTFTPDE